MSGFITFTKEPSSQQTWSSANWVFRAFLDNVIKNNASDEELVHELTVSGAHQQVELAYLAEENPALYRRVIDAFIGVCELVANEECRVSVGGRELEDESQRQYRYAVAQLSAMLSP